MAFTSDRKGPVEAGKLGCILIAEDTECDAITLRKAFDAAGVEAQFIYVSTCQDLRDYFERANAQKDLACPLPDALFLDPMLADGDCLSFLPEIRESAGKPFITVIVSGRSDVAYIRRFYELGANTFFPKPVRPVDIVNFLNFPGFNLSKEHRIA